ncbi:DNA utilization protein GntX [Novipirellula aureliae]|uniref:DNA utilization protein GntX n=1 Tax=Novipirellula aureliae TaxID=2527966 RepID=A0A5C6E2G1_9BACT|nr:phosphoribosyltransferase family protein [Novipirellula aureliae]TWU43833.1 DNA utilization protein GntX [Novipirellula aureliae]
MTNNNPLRSVAAALIDLTYPPCCPLCHRLTGQKADLFKRIEFCKQCEVGLTSSESQMRYGCRCCGFPMGRLTVDPTQMQLPATRCPQCRDKAFQFDAVIPLWNYHGLVCDAVVAAKYVHMSALAATLGDRLGIRVAERLVDDCPDWVTFVPSYFTRQLSRGGVGTATLAHAVAKRLQVPSRQLLKMTRRIAKQAWLDDDARVHNVRHAFQLKTRYAFGRSPDLVNRHILLVDDVYTTGATADEVAGVLREGGAAKVTIAVVARSVRSG